MMFNKYIKNLLLFPIYIRKILDLARLIEEEDRQITKDIITIKSDINVVFKYLSGLELHPKMPERLIVSDYRDVSKDHLVRYLAACEYINETDSVLDFACGCGYGSSCIKINSNPKMIIGCDIDKDVIEYAQRFFGKQGIEYSCKDVVNEDNFPIHSFDKIVSFETIEHIPNNISEKAIHNFYHWLKPGGIIICSVPDEEINQFRNFGNHFHFRHYTHEEFYQLLESVGFVNIRFIESEVSNKNDLPRNREFDSIIAIAEKV